MEKSGVCCDSIAALKVSAREVLEENILSFWLSKMVDHDNGGFYGRMDGKGVLEAAKKLIA